MIAPLRVKSLDFSPGQRIENPDAGEMLLVACHNNTIVSFRDGGYHHVERAPRPAGCCSLGHQPAPN